MKLLITTLILIATIGSASEKPLLKNGDFERGTSGWKGGKAKSRNELINGNKNKFLRVFVSERSTAFSTELGITLRKLLRKSKKMNITYKLRLSPDFHNGSSSYPFYIRLYGKSSSYYSSSSSSEEINNITRNESEWTEINSTIYLNSKGQEKYQGLVFYTSSQARGYYDIDDVKITLE